MRTGEQKLLDLGCCFAQDLRRLAYDGAPTECLYGTDLRLDFMELGYKLFLDREKFHAKLVAGDVFKPNAELDQLNGQIDIIQASSFFHLFDYDEQKTVAKRCIVLLKPQKDSLICGRQVGNVNAGDFQHRTRPHGKMFRHNPESWKSLWKEVGEETGTQWDVQVSQQPWTNTDEKYSAYQDPGMMRLSFSLRRL